MAGPPNEYRTLRTINTFLISGAGFSIAAKTRKKTIKKKEDKKEETMGGICTIWDYGGKATFDMHSVIHFKMLCYIHSHKLLNDVLN